MFVEVLLPLPLAQGYFYKVPKGMENEISLGKRVAVPFGKKKYYAGLILSFQNSIKIHSALKEVHYILDEKPLVDATTIEYWKWISKYYMCSLGEVYRVAIPSGFRLETDLLIKFNTKTKQIYNKEEILILGIVKNHGVIKLKDLCGYLNIKMPLKKINNLISIGALESIDKVSMKYKPLLKEYVLLNKRFQEDVNSLSPVFELLQNAPKQLQLLMTFLSGKEYYYKPKLVSDLLKEANVSRAILNSLVKKNIFSIQKVQLDRERVKSKHNSSNKIINNLSRTKNDTLKQIIQNLHNKKPIFFQCPNEIQREEILIELIDFYLKKKKQILFLKPDISPIESFIIRIENCINNKIFYWHSTQNINEKVEMWNKINNNRVGLVIGTRSSIFLPFRNLGCIIIDKSHDPIYKQQHLAPRYNARDCAVYYSVKKEIPIILCSSTPSLESLQNVALSKYQLVKMESTNNIYSPEIKIIDLKKSMQRKQIHGLFSFELILKIKSVLKEGKQVVIFHNRRGFSPIIECDTCGFTPNCSNCDIHLTFHKSTSQLKCHYCGQKLPVPLNCWACGCTNLITKGIGTQQIEEQCKKIFPNFIIQRFDRDSTMGKYVYRDIVQRLENNEINILIGTQMVSRKLDYKQVGLLVVPNADGMLRYPDFRTEEKTFQTLIHLFEKVSHMTGSMAIQTYMPKHEFYINLIKKSYNVYSKALILKRKQHNYPPYSSLVQITLKDKKKEKVLVSANLIVKHFKDQISDQILGPEEPLISRIKNLYHMHILLKLKKDNKIQYKKTYINSVIRAVSLDSYMRSVKVIVDVDPL